MVLSRQGIEAVKVRLLAHPLMLVVGTVALVTAHMIFFTGLHHAGMPLAVVSGLALFVIVKHFGLLGPLDSLLQRQTRMRPIRHPEGPHQP